MKGTELSRHVIQHVKKNDKVKVWKKPASLSDSTQVCITITFECYICKAPFMSYPHLISHSQLHARNCECPLCGIKLTENELKMHLCGNDPLITCDYCDEAFATTRKLLKHLEKRHTKNIKLYPCLHCTKFYSMALLTDIHMKRHEEKTKVYACFMCSKSYKTKDGLIAHVQAHNSKKGKRYIAGLFLAINFHCPCLLAGKKRYPI